MSSDQLSPGVRRPRVRVRASRLRHFRDNVGTFGVIRTALVTLVFVLGPLLLLLIMLLRGQLDEWWMMLAVAICAVFAWTIPAVRRRRFVRDVDWTNTFLGRVKYVLLGFTLIGGPLAQRAAAVSVPVLAVLLGLFVGGVAFSISVFWWVLSDPDVTIER